MYGYLLKLRDNFALIFDKQYTKMFCKQGSKLK